MKKIAVMGIDYEIVQITPQELLKSYEKSPQYSELVELFGPGCIDFSGLFDGHRNKIYLNINLIDDKKKKTLIHEFVEALDSECCTDLSHIQMQAIANSFFLAGIVNVEELIKNEPEDIEIKIDGDTALCNKN